MVSLIALITTTILFGFLFFYYIFFRFRFAFFKLRPTSHHQNKLPAVSVVLCAHNEKKNITSNLPLILDQEYEDFEVIVVDDHSTDDTYYVLREMQQNYPNLRIIKLNDSVSFFRGKKFPLSIGIREAKNNHLLLTDADCKPCSGKWIQAMAAHFSEKTEIILGYGKYYEKRGLLNRLIRFDTLYSAMQYFSFALAGNSYMGVGRNLAYKKETFNRVKGFSAHYNIMSGDDDLFVNSAARKDNVAIEINLDSFTVSEPKTSWIAWWKQKRRHLTSGVLYKKKHRVLIALYPLSLLGFYVSAGIALVSHNNFYFILSLLLLKVIVSMLVYKKVTEKLSEKKLFIFSLFFELVLIFFNGIILMSNRFSKPGKWK